MRISYQNITLESLQEKDIEWVRQWRNQDNIQRRMIYREHISNSQQQNWFKKITQDNSLFFICKIDHTPVGLIYANEVNWSQKISYNSGIFITDASLYGTGYPILIALLFTQCGFRFGLQENRIKILNNNLNAQVFNKTLGYVLDQEGAEWSSYTLTAERFKKAIAGFPSAFTLKEPIEFEWGTSEIDCFIQQLISELAINLEPFFKIIPSS